MVDLGGVTAQRAEAMAAAFVAAEANPDALVVTPAVIEIIAVRK